MSGRGCVPCGPGRTDRTFGAGEPVRGAKGLRGARRRASDAHSGSLLDPPGSRFGAFSHLREPLGANFGTEGPAKRSEKGLERICCVSPSHFCCFGCFPFAQTLFFGVGARGRRPVESADPEGARACGALEKQSLLYLLYKASNRRGRGLVRWHLMSDFRSIRAALAVRIALGAS